MSRFRGERRRVHLTLQPDQLSTLDLIPQMSSKFHGVLYVRSDIFANE